MRAGFTKRLLLAGLAGAGFVLAAGPAAAADAYPSKPITFILPVPPGNAADIAARALADKLATNVKQPVIIVNRPGAAGNIGAGMAAKAPADGYTVLIGSSGIFTANEYLYKLPFDPHKDFTPITLVYSGAPVLATSAKTGPTSLKQVIDESRAHPGKYSFASYGSGHISHILGEMLKSSASIDMLHVPYKNSPLTDVMAGHVDLIFESPLLVVNNKENLRPLAVVSAKRNPRMPNVPAVAEFVPGFEMTGWVGAFVPAGTPPAIVTRLNTEMVKVINSPEFKKQMDDLMLDIGGDTPAEFSEYVRSMSDRVGHVIKTANIKVD